MYVEFEYVLRFYKRRYKVRLRRDEELCLPAYCSDGLMSRSVKACGVESVLDA